MSLSAKEKRLKEIIEGYGSLVVAFSGGVDSSYLTYIAHQVLGERMLAITADSPTYPVHELKEAKEFAKKWSIPHKVINSNELDVPKFRENPEDRCYYCKKELLTSLIEIAKEEGFSFVAEGSTLDDLSDFRPGRRAISELGVKSPLIEAGLSKEEVRNLSRKAGLSTWNKPSFACLASRFPYHHPITKEKLVMVERAEEVLRELGFHQFRVRHHQELARIELESEDIKRAVSPEVKRKIVKAFKEIGYHFIALDLEGYRQGSMNEPLLRKDSKDG
ncbi:MAG: ATP-dependent sacrificial sulfur transferase LarE [Acidobacteria bacterium]|nr:ATP-dependent sacrificial sulfur transferase LarE [Acidobacteriota bacterium]